ncbi:hypothetical protein P9112_006924 [Eukaryota sp. TZLM1-RC]
MTQPVVVRCLAPSIYGETPLSDIETQVAEFIYRHCDKPYIEIEAKLGLLLSKKTHDRFWKTFEVINSEAILFSDPQFVHPYEFLTSIPKELFETVNMALNDRYQHSKEPGYVGAPIHCQHFIERDWIYGRGQKMRASVDSDGNVLKCVKKTRVEDLNIISRHTGLDWRLSASTEEPVPPPPLDMIEQERRKHRCSYFFELWRFDLTRVDVYKQEMLQESVYQIEIEIRDISTFAKRKEEIMNNSDDATATEPPLDKIMFGSFPSGVQLTDLARAFVSNVRATIIIAGELEEAEED